MFAVGRLSGLGRLVLLGIIRGEIPCVAVDFVNEGESCCIYGLCDMWGGNLENRNSAKPQSAVLQFALTKDMGLHRSAYTIHSDIMREHCTARTRDRLISLLKGVSAPFGARRIAG